MKKIILLSCLFMLCTRAGLTMAQELMPQDQTEQTTNAGGVKSMEDRVRHLEEAIGRDAPGNEWYDRIQISGLVKIEAGYEKVDFADLTVDDKETSDVDLATVELDVDANITDHVDGHVLYMYEEDDLFMDEGFITLTGTEAFPVYLIAGRQYIPFGNFDSHFVTDPNTLILGETNEGAVVAGCRFSDAMLDISAGAFNGEIEESGEDDTIDSFMAAVTVQPVEALLFGVSCISNLASSDALSEAVQDVDSDGEPDPLDDLIGGWSAFVTFRFLERFKIIGEYVAALDHFHAGEIYDAADVVKQKPSAWNAELGASIIEKLELALRYGGSDDGGADFLPETQYGAVLNWGLFKNTNLALEYIHGEFEDDTQETDSLVAQFAVEF